MKLTNDELERLKYDCTNVAGHKWFDWLLGSYRGKLNGNLPIALLVAIRKLIDDIETIRGITSGMGDSARLSHHQSKEVA